MTVTKNSNGSYSFEIKPRDESSAAPAALPSNRVMHVIGTVNEYWLQQAASSKRLESRKKRQAASRKRKKILTYNSIYGIK